MAKAIMFQGTGSDVGKSMLVAGLCRAYHKRGVKVAPFKPQNMSNNAAVSLEGGEIGRAQALQARAAGLEPSIHMNPVLLKPESEKGAQVIVCGERYATVMAKDYGSLKPDLMPHIMKSFDKLQAENELILVEGAGAVSEVNLRDNDLANMGFAEEADLSVILIGDINRGGVIAQLIGSDIVLSSDDRKRIKGFIINKFRGDPALFRTGYELIIAKTGWQGMGILPWFNKAHALPAEDALALGDDHLKTVSDRGAGNKGKTKIAVPILSRMANFDDLDPLKLDEAIDLCFIKPGEVIPTDTDMIILCGTKSTMGEMRFLQEQGWDIDIKAHYRRGGTLLGICGGYQLLGQTIADPHGIEGDAGEINGLGLLEIKTQMHPLKTLGEVKGR